ncbi:2,4-dienoyl-CoA reductase [Chlamydoabsidia padenii]|nr:2,4-dienoyl-CoA reductase [Chlamydoabsidia padenii]
MAAISTNQIFKNDLFNGKVLLCTGGGSGICRGLTEAVVRHGAKAVIVSRNKEKLEKAAEEMRASTGGDIIAVSGDVRIPEDMENAVKKTIELFGRLDYLINGAAGNFLSPLQHLSYRAFRTVIEIDLLGTFNTTKAAVEHIKKTKGAILNISATLHYTGTPYQLHVGAAKNGIDAMTKHLSVELGPHGVRVNGIAPGPIGGTAGMEKLGVGFEEEGIPLGRIGDIKDIEQATVFLLSEGASFITGHTLVVDGGHWMNPNYVAYPAMVHNPIDFKSLL